MCAAFIFRQTGDVCISRTVPTGSTDSPAATRLALVLVLLLPEGAPVITVSPCVFLPPWTSGTGRLFKTRTPHFPPQRLLKATFASEEIREVERNPYQFGGKPEALTCSYPRENTIKKKKLSSPHFRGKFTILKSSPQRQNCQMK